MLMCLESLHQQQLTTCMFVSNLTYLISGSSNGSIKVYKYQVNLHYRCINFLNFYNSTAGLQIPGMHPPNI